MLTRTQNALVGIEYSRQLMTVYSKFKNTNTMLYIKAREARDYLIRQVHRGNT